MTNIKKKKKKKKSFFFFLGISRIPFQVGNSANSATFPRSRKITGPFQAVIKYLLASLQTVVQIASATSKTTLSKKHCIRLNDVSLNRVVICHALIQYTH